ncbi:MAG TPA: alpha/beta hydrolase [Acidimicrobiales bacterium]
MSDEMARVLQILGAMPRNDDATPVERRLEMDGLSGAAPMAEGTEVEVVDANGVPGQWLRPPNGVDAAALLYLHGGGYCVGSVISHTPLVSKLAAAAGIPALIVDYRLGPEHPFPAAVDDAVTAFRWLVAQGLSPGRIAVAGDSAGGGLTLATLLALRAAGDAPPGAAACMSPWTDLTMSGPSMDANVDRDPMLDRPRLQTYADWYLGPDGDPTDPLVSPRFADLAGLPPVVIHAADDEVLLDDARLVAEAIDAAGGTVEYRTWPGAFHVFHATAGLVPEAGEAVAAMGAFLRRHLA